MSQLTEGKCLRCASFLSRPQNTCGEQTCSVLCGALERDQVKQIICMECIHSAGSGDGRMCNLTGCCHPRHAASPTCTMPSVAMVTGSLKSPPGGLTAPTMVTLPSRLGEPRHVTRPARS